MTLVSGELKLVTDKPEVVSQVWLRAPNERLHGTGMVTTGRDFEPVVDGIVSFTALPGPIVMVLLANGIPTSTVKLLVPDKQSASLRECIEAAGLADDGTLSALEELALETARIAAQIASADQLETWATETTGAAQGIQAAIETWSDEAAKTTQSMQEIAETASRSATNAAEHETNAVNSADRAETAAELVRAWSDGKLLQELSTQPGLYIQHPGLFNEAPSGSGLYEIVS